MDSAKLIQILLDAGWRQVRQRGSHVTLKHPLTHKLCTVPHPKKDLPTGTVKSILKNAGLK
ncbi:type II toxin-antitoxin system HicA family toxin [Massilia endophytica]|uniref:type II toxin-antitoxin system HicA family toxin n=1 Tax=Massilia endophytica TaxID=2899220 RepID=UPI001E449266|nr:type II toxin-antitoxin system HicA family toxin [Massilia endophytica]UGQ47819.1 type II toxin-antitoxin system HicA family toxin [Massilia endophytica]